MNFQRVADAYGNAETAAVVESQDKHAIILLMFDELLRSMNLVIEQLNADSRDHEIFAKHYARSLSIIYTLQSSLDMERGGDVALSLFRVYAYGRQMLMKDNSEKTSIGSQKAHQLLSEIRQAWADMGMAQ